LIYVLIYEDLNEVFDKKDFATPLLNLTVLFRIEINDRSCPIDHPICTHFSTVSLLFKRLYLPVNAESDFVTTIATIRRRGQGISQPQKGK
jgi:hypothetical protein